MTAPATIRKSEMDYAVETCVKHGVPIREIIFDWKEGRVRVLVGEPEKGERTGYENVKWRK